jgi:bacillithiol system protein YtxJ
MTRLPTPADQASSNGEHPIEDSSGLEAALTAPLFLLFKHSPTCPVSARARQELRAFLEDDPPPSAWIDVIGSRPISIETEARTGVRHESPQALLLARGKVLWHASHGAITREALAAALLDAQSGR